jgi:radical SAM protein with 4Fe4S-binding SPASM domain
MHREIAVLPVATPKDLDRCSSNSPRARIRLTLKLLNAYIHQGVLACDKYVNDNAYRFGNLSVNTLGEIIDGSENLRRAVAMTDFTSENYESHCPYGSVCKGGCPHDAYLVKRYGGGSACCGLGPLIEKLREFEIQDRDV